MKTTGNMLRDGIALHSLRRDTAQRGFDGTLKAFPGEAKESPQQVMARIERAELAICSLQEAQMRFNLAVKVDVDGMGPMTLAYAIKIVGGAGKIEKMWKSVASPQKDRYGGYNHDDVRDPTKVVAGPTVTTAEAVEYAITAAKRSSALRAAISKGNLQMVEIEDLNPALFE